MTTPSPRTLAVVDREPTAPPRSWASPETHYLVALDHPWYRALVGLQGTLTASTSRFWSDRRVPFAHLPVTTGSVSSPMGLGSDSAPVCVQMFGQRTYLADSMQFGLEYVCRLSPTGGWYLMPSFRGEDSDPTHLCQFFHSEAELPCDLTAVLTTVEEYVLHISRDMLEMHAADIEHIAGGTDHVEALLARPSCPRLTFDEAAEIVGPRHIVTDATRGWRTLTRLGERELIAQFGPAVWVTHWDELAVPFYQATDGEGRALNADLLLGPGEVVGCGQRHRDGGSVMAALHRHGVESASYEWYARMKDQRPLLTSGFGLGVERYLMWLLAQDDIRDFQLLPRINGRTVLP